MTLLLLGVVSGLLVPLAAAVVIAAIVVPLVDLLERWHVRRWLAAALVLLLGMAMVVAVTALIVKGVIEQSDEIAAGHLGLPEGGRCRAPDRQWRAGSRGGGFDDPVLVRGC